MRPPPQQQVPLVSKSAVIRLLPVAVAALSLTSAPALADKIANKVAVFSGLDKITGRIISFDVYIDETVQFGTLRVTPKVCYSRPSTEAAETDAFVQVQEITLDNKIKPIFGGWMFAASPGLNAVEHPVYDVWLSDCRMESDIPPPSERTGDARTAKANTGQSGGSDRSDVSLLQVVGGIPVPPVKPPAPASIDTTDPNAPTEDNGADAPPAEILD